MRHWEKCILCAESSALDCTHLHVLSYGTPNRLRDFWYVPFPWDECAPALTGATPETAQLYRNAVKRACGKLSPVLAIAWSRWLDWSTLCDFPVPSILKAPGALIAHTMI